MEKLCNLAFARDTAHNSFSMQAPCKKKLGEHCNKTEKQNDSLLCYRVVSMILFWFFYTLNIQVTESLLLLRYYDQKDLNTYSW